MSVDGAVISDLRYLLSESRPAASFLLVCGPAGSGKSVTLRLICDGVTVHGMRLTHGLPTTTMTVTTTEEVNTATKGWSDERAHLFCVDYNTLRSSDTLKASVAVPLLTYAPGTVVLIDDIEAIDYLERIRGSSHRLKTLVDRLLQSPSCILVSSAVDVRHVPQWLLTICPPIVYNLGELTPTAVHHYLSGLSDADAFMVCAARDNVDMSSSFLKTRRALMLSLCRSRVSRTVSQPANRIVPLCHLLGQPEPDAYVALKEQRISSLPKLFGLDVVSGRMDTLVRHFMHRDEAKEHVLLASVASTTGILLHGPSGCGKTALVMRLAEIYPDSFFFVSCTTLFSKYLGESEQRLRDAFRQARQSTPSLLVLDDVDIIGTSRGFLSPEDGSSGSGGGGLDVTRRMLAALLCELDGLEDNTHVLVIATTSSLDKLDEALLRQGRFETLLYVPPMSFEGGRDMALAFFSRFNDVMGVTPDCLSRLVATSAEGSSAVSLKSFLRGLLEQMIEGAERKGGGVDDHKDHHNEMSLDLPTEALVKTALATTDVFKRANHKWLMEYKSSFELRWHLLDTVNPPGKTKPSRNVQAAGGLVLTPATNTNDVDLSDDVEPEDPTALVRELPALDKINALNASLKNEEAVQKYVEARNLSIGEAARYIMANGSTGQKKSLFQRLRETVEGLDMTSVAQVLMIVVDSMWVQDPELQYFAPESLLEVLPLLNSTVTRELLMVTSTMLSVKTADIRIAWNKLFIAFVDYLTVKQLESDVVPLALKKTEHAEPQDQRELSCDLIGAICRHLPRSTVEQKLLNKVLALCQDTNVGVRRHMCQQLGIIARSLGVEKAKEKIAQELFELLNDEDQSVSHAAFSCLVDLVEFFGPAYRREHLYPIIKGFITHPPEEVVSLIVGEFGRLLCEIKGDIQTNEDVLLFANFYQNAALKSDDAIRFICAYNLPSVTASLPIEVFPTHLAPCCDALSRDPCEPVRRSIASGLHELVALLQDRAALHLRKTFLELLGDSKKSVLRALSSHTSILLDCFVRQLKPVDRRAFFSRMEVILLELCVRGERDWRIMDYVLNILSSYFMELQEVTLCEKIIPALLKYERYGAFCLKRRCAEMCVKIVSGFSNVNSKVQFFSKLNNEYAHSPLCLLRKGYLRCVSAACMYFSRRFIRERMLDCCFELQHDNMELVRIELARLLPSLRKVLEPVTTGSSLDEYQDMMRRLQMDESNEVRAVARDALEMVERRDREMRRDVGRVKFEEENREDKRREMAEGQLLDVAKEFDKAERRSKLRDLLKTERERDQAEVLRKAASGRRTQKTATVTQGVRTMPRVIPPALASYPRTKKP